MNAALSDQTTPHGVKLTVRDFLLLSDNGAFDVYSKAELIDGEIFCVNAQYARHARAKSQIFLALVEALRATGSTLSVLVEVAVQLSDRTLVEPDLVITSYAGDGVVPVETVSLIVEVSDTTLDYDLKRKAPRYAAAGIAEYWVADLENRKFYQFWAAGPEGYGERADAGLEQGLSARSIAGLTLPGQG